jgi:hypothetical protein
MASIDKDNFEEYYKKRAFDLSNENFKVLRCDCFNECVGSQIMPFIKGDVTCIELVKERASHARLMYPDVNVICADLQDIPKSKGYFDLILDFSTIDHITNYKKVLDEYKRVLNLITWTSPFGYGKGLNLARQCFN